MIGCGSLFKGQAAFRQGRGSFILHSALGRKMHENGKGKGQIRVAHVGTFTQLRVYCKYGIYGMFSYVHINNRTLKTSLSLA